jgi:hypothetical protein
MLAEVYLIMIIIFMTGLMSVANRWVQKYTTES